MFLSSAVSISIFPSFSPFSMPSSTSPSIKTPAPSPLSSAFCAGLEADPLLLDSDFLSRGRPGVAIMWCSHCVEDNEVVREPNQDCVYCSVCGKILRCFVYKRHRMSGKPKRNKGLRGRPANIGNLSDFDDLEVAQYLYNEKEKHLRKIIWEEMHKECLQEQAGNGASQDRMTDGFEELISTQDLEKMVATTLVKSRERKRNASIQQIARAQHLQHLIVIS